MNSLGSDNLFVNLIYSLLVALPWWFIPLIVGAFLFRFLKKRHSHTWRIKTSRRRLSKLKQIPSPAQQFGYLRSTDPFVFEEMVLTALASFNHRIIRNRRYTGDGGIDGRVLINEQPFYIQAKRYKRHINAQHVAEFSEICRRNNVKGLFVHTGKTGKLSKANANNIDIVSGQRILELFLEKSFEVKLLT